MHEASRHAQPEATAAVELFELVVTGPLRKVEANADGSWTVTPVVGRPLILTGPAEVAAYVQQARAPARRPSPPPCPPPPRRPDAGACPPSGSVAADRPTCCRPARCTTTSRNGCPPSAGRSGGTRTRGPHPSAWPPTTACTNSSFRPSAAPSRCACWDAVTEHLTPDASPAPGIPWLPPCTPPTCGIAANCDPSG